jgi:hypothetical protein
MKKTIPALCAAAVMLVALAGCTITLGPPRILEQTVDVPAIHTISVANTVGSIEITGTSRADVRVTAYVQQVGLGWFGTPAPLESIELDITTGNGIQVSHSPIDARGISVSYEIEVPSWLDVETVTSETGSITVGNVDGSPLLQTSTGSITATDISGTVTAETSTGSVTVRNTGSIRSISSDTGSILAEITGLPAGGGPVVLETSTGSVAAWINPELALSIEAETGTGGISVDSGLGIAISYFSSHRLMGTMNGGGTLLDLQTSTGSIVLEGLW